MSAAVVLGGVGPLALSSPEWKAVDRMEAKLRTMPQADVPVEHTFTPGMYGRKVIMRAGTFIISKIHKTEHQYDILQGKVLVWTAEEGVKLFTAPYSGVTKPMTRRVLFNLEETHWKTFHPTTETDVSVIEEQIIFKNPTDGALEIQSTEEIMKIEQDMTAAIAELSPKKRGAA